MISNAQSVWQVYSKDHQPPACRSAVNNSIINQHYFGALMRNPPEKRCIRKSQFMGYSSKQANFKFENGKTLTKAALQCPNLEPYIPNTD